MSQTDIMPGPLREQVVVSEEQVNSHAIEFGIELEQCESVALTGLINQTRPRDALEESMRFDIVRAADRKAHGQNVTERYLSLHGIFRALRPKEATE